MNKRVISTPLGPSGDRPIFSSDPCWQFVIVSGQVALDPSTGKFIEDKSIQAQTRRVLENLLAIVSAAVDLRTIL